MSKKSGGSELAGRHHQELPSGRSLPKLEILPLLTVAERKRLAACEKRIEAGLGAFVEVGTALMEIRDSRLYREEHPNFEAYVQSVLAISRPRAYELMDSAQVMRDLSAIADIRLPQNEAQARELRRLRTPEERCTKWTEVVVAAGDAPLTAKRIRATIHSLLPEQELPNRGPGALKSQANLPAVSLGEVAKAAGISKTSAGCALANSPGVSEATRRHVLKIAMQLGYSPDARLTSRMTGIRRTSSKDLLPIAWLNALDNKNAWHEYQFLSPILEGAQTRCLELGYRIEEIWTKEPGFSMRRISRIIHHQGINGILVTDPARHVRLNWNFLAAVGIGSGLLVPALDQIKVDIRFNLVLALKSLKRLGYQRIGVCLTEQMDRFSANELKATSHFFNSTIPEQRRITPLFFPYFIAEDSKEKVCAEWLQQEQPDAIVCLDSRMIEWVQGVGFQVPEEIGVIHLAIENDVLDWAGIYANKREVGALAAESVISLIQNRKFGIPSIPSIRLVRGLWREGRTLLNRKPK